METARIGNPPPETNSGCIRVVGQILFFGGCFLTVTAFLKMIIGTEADIVGSLQSFAMGAVSGTIGWYMRKKFKPRPPEPDNYERALLKLASQQGGRLKVGVVALNLGITIETASKLLNHYANQGVAQAEVDEKGVITYVFPDFLP